MSHHHQEHPKKAPRRGWFFTFAGILMIVAMLVYVLTLDESEVPGETGIPPVVAPANP